MILSTEEILSEEVSGDMLATIAVQIPGRGTHVFTGVKHFHLFVEEDVHQDKFGVTEMFSLSEEFEAGVYEMVKKRLRELLKI